MNWRERIVGDAEVLGGKPVVKGTRVSVELVLELSGRGYTARDIVEQYDQITIDDVLACIAYAAEVVGFERTIRRPE